MKYLSSVMLRAGWLGGTEYLIPELVKRIIETHKKHYWGHGYIDYELAKVLKRISDDLGAWVDLDEAGVAYELFEPTPIPIEYVESIDREQSLSDEKKLLRENTPIISKRTYNRLMKDSIARKYLKGLPTSRTQNRPF